MRRRFENVRRASVSAALARAMVRTSGIEPAISPLTPLPAVIGIMVSDFQRFQFGEP
jgi:hypothetical protein